MDTKCSWALNLRPPTWPQRFFALMAFAASCAAAVGAQEAPVLPGNEGLDLTLRQLPPTPAAATPHPSAGRLSKAISAAIRPSVMEAGVEASAEAVRECLQEDERSGGAGPLSTAFGRPISITHHCRRY